MGEITCPLADTCFQIDNSGGGGSAGYLAQTPCYAVEIKHFLDKLLVPGANASIVVIWRVQYNNSARAQVRNVPDDHGSADEEAPQQNMESRGIAGGKHTSCCWRCRVLIAEEEMRLCRALP
jgi:hypothetical protein